MTRQEIVDSFKNSDNAQGITEESDYYYEMADVLFRHYDDDKDGGISATEFVRFSDDVAEQDDYL